MLEILQKTCFFHMVFHMVFPIDPPFFVAEIPFSLTPNYVEEVKMEDVRAEAAVAVASARCCGCAVLREVTGDFVGIVEVS